MHSIITQDLLIPAYVLFGSIVLIGFPAILIIKLLSSRWEANLDLPIERKEFLTRAELDVFRILRRALPRHHTSCQVAMGALLKPRRGLSNKDFWSTRNKFGQKITDFVVINPDDGTVTAIIELDDASHNKRKDEDRDAMLALGHYRVIRIPSKPRPSDQIVRELTSGLL